MMTVHHPNGRHPNDPGTRRSSGSGDSAREKFDRAMALHAGVGGKLDPAEARRLFAEAAQEGDPVARLWMGRLLWQGMLGFPKDRDKAREIASAKVIEETERLTKAGDAQAAFALAAALFEGLTGLDGRVARALELFRQAAEAGHPGAAYNLGYILAKGLGAKADAVEAFQWYLQAARAGHPKAMFKLGRALNGGYGAPKDRAQALDWFREAARRGHAGAMFRLGLAYARGSGVSKDDAAAIEWYQQAARAGLEDAQDVLRKRQLSW
jgi:TPR repeat protein